MSQKDFLVELGTEELPPKALKKLSNAFTQGIVDRLKSAQLSFDSFEAFAAPRRLALLIKGLETAQPDQQMERRGPAVKAAFDAEGKATKAAEGFARSNGVTVDQLETLETDKGAWLVYRAVQQGSETTQLLPEIISQSLNELPIPKRMRWGARRTEFVRPVHWLVMLMGEEVVDCEILGLKSGNQTRGHRFHANQPLTINQPADYQNLLREQGKVMALFEERRNLIKKQVTDVATGLGGEAVIDVDLLDEVTALNEWPVALSGRFDDEFLEVPAEALISSMKEHQKYFHVVSNEGNLLPHFITISNIESLQPEHVVSGNERVIRPRLADAKFFFDTDKKTSLDARRETLKPIIFQAQLGSLFNKTDRIAKLAGFIAKQEGGQEQLAVRAGELCKSDLTSEMVLEFPELQGIMGQYYGANDGEPEEVCLALNEQYMPRFAGDELPSNLTGCAVAIADKIDTITGIFGINQPPSGNKDPFALRRATLGVLRIIVEKKLDLDLRDLINQSIEGYKSQGVQLPAEESSANKKGLTETVLDFMLERFRSWYQDEQIPVEVFLSVKALKPSRPFDFDQRVKAVNSFSQMAEAETLSAANKRVSNILAKAGDLVIPDSVDPALMTEAAEKSLASALADSKEKVAPILEQRQYSVAMESLAPLKDSVDRFFDEVLVNAEDEQVRLNRYALLKQLRSLFLHVADISLL
ncbi:glycine--tRNA ligase subunit beta [Endozoicomonas numazuensis]|uniref:Glycine--tRNA ligase beta subunit n=1 Tax=Endozoicomonas numazuensis TaxID=1137799 RepID=A0A081NDS8_9GAMM|nr:glycine--tRNA ligase subunit beta [Endozoicomonas numazuensis]KEQ16601.1 glycine-tRNA synthetase subunit beta [Endozoicomonas numazuensis]